MTKINVKKSLEQAYWSSLKVLIVLLLIFIGFLGFITLQEKPKFQECAVIDVYPDVSPAYSPSNPDGGIDGKALFKANCASCHNKNMKSDMTGPALGGVEERWENKEDLYAWIRNSQQLVAENHPYAVNLFEAYNKSVMTAFPNLADEEIAEILEYIDHIYNGGLF